MQLCVSVSLMSCTVLTFFRALAHISVAVTNELVKQEGWIHHLARHAVACYLTRGQCYISWERGTEVFDGKTGVLTQFYDRSHWPDSSFTEYLLDWDPGKQRVRLSQAPNLTRLAIFFSIKSRKLDVVELFGVFLAIL
jgi:hypothetical protein